MTEPGNSRRIRMTFGKSGALKYIGHLDLAKIWERVLRRAQINLTYSQGFVARPHIQFASPLALGITSECELIDVWLEGELPLKAVVSKLNAVSPPGLPIYTAQEIPERAPVLQTIVHSAVYRITIEDAARSTLQERVEGLLAQTALPRTRRDKIYDLRPLIIDLAVLADNVLRAELNASEQTGVGRPDELIGALGYDAGETAVHRLELRLKP